jgi:dTDP-glucose 4,6-dehydratase
MKILVIGGGGFQGSHMVESWLKDGHEVTILNTLSERTLQNISSFDKDVRLVWGSITDREIVGKTVRGHDVIVALAARINVDESIESPTMVSMVNILGTQNILDAAVQHDVRVIYGSSCEVYGSAKPQPVTEESALKPHSPYAASKAGADRMAFAYYESYGLNVTIMRPCNIFGERQKEGRGGAVIPIFTNNALQRKPLTIFGDGEQRREYMHVADVVAAYDLVLNRSDLAGETLNCGTGETISIKEIASFIAQRLGVAVVHGPARPGEIESFLLDSSKITSLGFRPRVKLLEGLERYVQWREELERDRVFVSAVGN